MQKYAVEWQIDNQKSNNTTETMRKLKQLKYVINVEIKY